MITREYNIQFTSESAATLRALLALVDALKGLDTAAIKAKDDVRQVGDSSSGLADRLRSAAGAGDSLKEKLLGMASAGAALGMVSAASNALAESLKEARDFARQTAEETLNLRDSVRELRSLKGDKVTTTEATKGVIDLMLKSGGTDKEMTQFEMMWESTIFAAKQKGNWKLNDKQTQEAKEESAKFAIANRIDPATMGKMVPSIGVSEEVTSVDQLLGKLGAMHQMAIEGIGTFSPIMQVEQKLRGVMVRPGGGGAAKSSEELMAIVSAATVESGKEGAAARSIEQTWRELSVANNTEKKATFDKYRIKAGDDFATRVEKIAPLLEEARAKGIGDLDALQTAGFHNANANTKIIQFVEDRKLLRDRVDRAPKSADAARVRAISREFREQNPDRFAAASEFAARQEVGEESRDLKVARQYAEAIGTKRGLFGRGLGQLGERILDVRLPVVGSVSQGLLAQPAHDKALDSIISAQILAAVPDAKKRFPDLTPGIEWDPRKNPARGARMAEIMRGLSEDERNRVFAGLNSSATGGAGRGGNDKLNQAAANLNQAAVALQKAAQARPAPQPAAGPIRAVRP